MYRKSILVLKFKKWFPTRWAGINAGRRLTSNFRNSGYKGRFRRLLGMRYQNSRSRAFRNILRFAAKVLCFKPGKEGGRRKEDFWAVKLESSGSGGCTNLNLKQKEKERKRKERYRCASTMYVSLVLLMKKFRAPGGEERQCHRTFSQAKKCVSKF